MVYIGKIMKNLAGAKLGSAVGWVQQEGFLRCQTPTSTVSWKLKDAEWRMEGVRFRVKNEGWRVFDFVHLTLEDDMGINCFISVNLFSVWYIQFYHTSFRSFIVLMSRNFRSHPLGSSLHVCTSRLQVDMFAPKYIIVCAWGDVFKDAIVFQNPRNIF